MWAGKALGVYSRNGTTAAGRDEGMASITFGREFLVYVLWGRNRAGGRGGIIGVVVGVGLADIIL